MFRSMHETSKFESRRFLPEATSSESGWNEITVADIEKFKANDGDSNRFFFNKGIGARVVGGQEAEPHRYFLQAFSVVLCAFFSVGHGNYSSHLMNGIVELS